ncbi:MAG TPA: hypothetical protein VH482_28630 [Thermomicrobiales bacterium]
MSATPGSSPSPLLFSPITLNKVTIKNRIVSTAHATGYAVGGYPKDLKRAAVLEVHRIGGCVAPLQLYQALLEATRTARLL